MLVLLWSYVAIQLLTVLTNIRLAVHAEPSAWWANLIMPGAVTVGFSIGLLRLRRWAFWMGTAGAAICLVNVLAPAVLRLPGAGIAPANGIKAAVAGVFLWYLTRPRIRTLFARGSATTAAARPSRPWILYLMSIVPMFGLLLGSLYCRSHWKIARACFGVTALSAAVYFGLLVFMGRTAFNQG